MRRVGALSAGVVDIGAAERASAAGPKSGTCVPGAHQDSALKARVSRDFWRAAVLACRAPLWVE